MFISVYKTENLTSKRKGNEKHDFMDQGKHTKQSIKPFCGSVSRNQIAEITFKFNLGGNGPLVEPKAFYLQCMLQIILDPRCPWYLKFCIKGLMAYY